MWFILIFAFSSVILTNTEYVSYDGYRIYEIIPKDSNEIDILSKLSSLSDIFDFWKLSKIENDPAHVMVPPQYRNDFENILNENKLKFTILEQNVGTRVKFEEISQNFMRTLSPKIGFIRYHRFDEINEYLDLLAEIYPKTVNVTVVGKSYEGRTIKTITISNGVQESEKKTIFVDAGIHAREWVAPATALYIIHQLVENLSENKDLLENFNWIILPVVNPDGYEYTHTKQRFWRKTRKPNQHCVGTDGNRNFDFHFGEVGASSNGCAENYRGPNAFSELETQIVRDILKAESGRCLFYLTLHSYGQYLLYPWGWTSELPETWRDLDEVSRAGAVAIWKATKARYTVGSSTNVLYAAAGGSDDYAFGVENVPISITMELPARGAGFNPPSSQIKSIVKESWIGIREMAKKVEEKYVL